MSLEAEFGTNQKKEVEGVEINDFTPNKDGTVPTFVIASTSRLNEDYYKVLEKETKPFRRAGGVVKAIGTKKAEAITFEVFLKTVLKGWRNVELDNQPLPFSIDNARMLFTRLPRLYDKLIERANDIETFQDEVREEEAGN